MNAVDTMRQELTILQQAAEEYITEEGHCMGSCRYKYQTVVQQMRALRESIAWLTDRGIGG